MIWINGQEILFSNFPNGETKMNEDSIQQNLDEYQMAHIVFKFQEDGDLINLMFVKKYVDTLSPYKAKLTIMYMPYSRMDRVEDSSAFTLKYVSEFINYLDFCTVNIIEPHSDVTMALVDKVKAMSMTVDIAKATLKEIGFNKDIDYIYFPDGGAEKRYSKHFKGIKTLTGFKKRDFKTGEITSLEIIGSVDSPSRKVVMIDDLCSRGGTFKFGAQKLKSMGVGEIYLVVAHCEDTVHEGDLLSSENNLIERIFTTNSILTKNHKKIAKLNIR